MVACEEESISYAGNMGWNEQRLNHTSHFELAQTQESLANHNIKNRS